MGGGGSTGAIDALTVMRLVDQWLDQPDPTSATWKTMWDARDPVQMNIDSNYQIGYNRPNSSAGWYRYLRDVAGSTKTHTSTETQTGQIASAEWRDFRVDIPGLLPTGAGDVAQGRRIYTLLSTVHTRYKNYRNPNHPLRWLMCAWAASGSSALGTS